MSRLIRSSLTGLALTAVALLAPVAAPAANAAPSQAEAATAPAATTCRANASIRDDADRAAQVIGVCQPSHAIHIECITGRPGPGGTVDTWYLLQDNTIGVIGWVLGTQMNSALLKQPRVPCV